MGNFISNNGNNDNSKSSQGSKPKSVSILFTGEIFESPSEIPRCNSSSSELSMKNNDDWHAENNERYEYTRDAILLKSSRYDELQHYQDQFDIANYNFSRTTEETYMYDGAGPRYEEEGGEGRNRYGKLRAQLDYTYHAHYSPLRRRLQDSIVDYFMTEMTHSGVRYCHGLYTDPWIVFTAGAMGVGKSHTMKWLDKQGYFPYKSFVRVDPDEIRQQLPELPGYIEHDMQSAGTKTHKEAGYIAEIVELAALRDGRNVLVDGSLQDSKWYTGHFKKLKKDYPGFKIAILYFTAPENQILQRAERRAQTTGRRVPQDLLRQTLKKVPVSVDILSKLPEVDTTITISNADDSSPVLLTPGEDWVSFKTHWVAFCSDVESAEEFKGLIGPAAVLPDPPSQGAVVPTKGVQQNSSL